MPAPAPIFSCSRGTAPIYEVGDRPAIQWANDQTGYLPIVLMGDLVQEYKHERRMRLEVAQPDLVDRFTSAW